MFVTDFLFRHEKPRKFQLELIQDMYSAIARGGIFLANAPTGSGKTDAALSAALTYASGTNLAVFFLTPKISQHKIALDAAKAIAEKHGANIRAIDLVGRRHMCVLPSEDYDNESFYHFCENKRKRRSCEAYNNVRKLDFSNEKAIEKLLKEYGNGKSFSEAIEFGAVHGMCPYELLLRVGKYSNLIIADYYHFLAPQIRDGLMARIDKRVEDSIVIIDEAHNLGSRARSYLSITVTSKIIRRAEKELGMFGFESEMLYERFEEWANAVLGKKDEVVIEKEEMQGLLMNFSSGLMANLEDASTAYINLKAKKSAALKLAVFLSEWESDIECVRIVNRTPDGFKISRKILDPSLLTQKLNEAYAAVLMSGTLQPFEMHIDVLGLDKQRVEAKSYPSPFPERNMLNIVATAATTRYSKRNRETYSIIAGEVDRIVSATPGGVAIFFPSYNVMNSITPLMNGAQKRGLYLQQSKMKPGEIRQLIKDFSESGGVLCGVQGGSLAEGVDFCHGEIKTIIIIGVGLEEMNAEVDALIKYYEKKFGMGWEYAYLYPGTIKALQAAGRARRKESDRAAVVYFDERFRWKNYKWIFNNSHVIVTERASRLVESFWKSGWEEKKEKTAPCDEGYGEEKQ